MMMFIQLILKYEFMQPKAKTNFFKKIITFILSIVGSPMAPVPPNDPLYSSLVLVVRALLQQFLDRKEPSYQAAMHAPGSAGPMVIVQDIPDNAAEPTVSRSAAIERIATLALEKSLAILDQKFGSTARSVRRAALSSEPSATAMLFANLSFDPDDVAVFAALSGSQPKDVGPNTALVISILSLQRRIPVYSGTPLIPHLIETTTTALGNLTEPHQVAWIIDKAKQTDQLLRMQHDLT